ncbi:MAG TPA: R3H domain-containing nucleic acid-binding protein [Thermomicrobiales bacterium]
MPNLRPTTIDRKHYEQEITDNLEDLLAVLPSHIATAVEAANRTGEYGALIEIVLDLGRRPEARFQHAEIYLTDVDVTREDLRYVAERIGSFGDDNRAGIERTLHRISAIRNRTGDIVGLTCRIGRAVYGTIAIIRDLIETGESILLLGRPGVGKTTMLRETARVLADDLRKRVIVVDTSNEIAGDGDIPHPAIGRARRMQVPTPTAQHAVMIEAVENHMPEVIVIDEIGTELEAMAARTIAERGVQLIGTAHGNTLENLMMNPTLADLVGGIQSVTLSDEEARRRGTQKSILERKAPPTFTIMVEIVDRDEVTVHRDVAATVDAILRGAPVRAETRRRSDDGQVLISNAEDRRRDPTLAARAGILPDERRSSHRRSIVDITTRQPISRGSEGNSSHSGGEAPWEGEGVRPASTSPFAARGRGTETKPLRIYPFGVSRNRLESAINQLKLPAIIVRDPREADLVMTLKNYYRTKPQPIRDAEARGTPVYVLRSNTIVQMENVLSGLLPRPEHPSLDDLLEDGAPEGKVGGDDEVVQALHEAEEAISAVMEGAPPITLRPQSKYIRRLQHELADRYNLGSRSRGREPFRRVEIYREGLQ